MVAALVAMPIIGSVPRGHFVREDPDIGAPTGEPIICVLASQRALARIIMNKAFTRETETDDDDLQEPGLPLPAGARNYMTPGGFARMKDELERLVQKERPELVATVAW